MFNWMTLVFKVEIWQGDRLKQCAWYSGKLRPSRWMWLSLTDLPSSVCSCTLPCNIPWPQPTSRASISHPRNGWPKKMINQEIHHFNPLNAELNPICYLLALLGPHHFLHISRIRVKSLTLRLLMSYIYIYIYICIYMEHQFLMFLDHTQRRTTVGRTPLDE